MSSAGVFLLTGLPGIGKTTVLVKTVDILMLEGLSADGFLTREVRDGHQRVGFVASDLRTGRSCWLARVGAAGGERVGRYAVFRREFEKFLVEVLTRAGAEAQVVVVDEIGPMEMKSSLFVPTVKDQLRRGKALLATIHRSIAGESARLLHTQGVVTWEVTLENRDSLPAIVAQEVQRAVIR